MKWLTQQDLPSPNPTEAKLGPEPMSPCWLCGLSCPSGLSLTGLVLQGPQQSEKQKVAQPLAPAYQSQAVTGLAGLTVSKETTRVSQSIRLEQCPKETRTSLESHAGKERVPARGGIGLPERDFTQFYKEAHTDGSKVGGTTP